MTAIAVELCLHKTCSYDLDWTQYLLGLVFEPQALEHLGINWRCACRLTYIGMCHNWRNTEEVCAVVAARKAHLAGTVNDQPARTPLKFGRSLAARRGDALTATLSTSFMVTH